LSVSGVDDSLGDQQGQDEVLPTRLPTLAQTSAGVGEDDVLGARGVLRESMSGDWRQMQVMLALTVAPDREEDDPARSWSGQGVISS